LRPRTSSILLLSVDDLAEEGFLKLMRVSSWNFTSC
jgi:hypothetical protein